MKERQTGTVVVNKRRQINDLKTYRKKKKKDCYYSSCFLLFFFFFCAHKAKQIEIVFFTNDQTGRQYVN